MAASRQDFQVSARSADQIYFALSDGTDLTNIPLRWRAAESIDAPVAVVEKTNTNPSSGITVTNPSGGAGYITIDDTDFEDYGLLWHQLDGQFPGAGWLPLIRGRIVANPGIGPAA